MRNKEDIFEEFVGRVDQYWEDYDAFVDYEAKKVTISQFEAYCRALCSVEYFRAKGIVNFGDTLCTEKRNQIDTPGNQFSFFSHLAARFETRPKILKVDRPKISEISKAKILKTTKIPMLVKDPKLRNIFLFATRDNSVKKYIENPTTSLEDAIFLSPKEEKEINEAKKKWWDLQRKKHSLAREYVDICAKEKSTSGAGRPPPPEEDILKVVEEANKLLTKDPEEYKPIKKDAIVSNRLAEDVAENVNKSCKDLKMYESKAARWLREYCTKKENHHFKLKTM